MSHIVVAGLVNVETTCRVDGFPVEYSPVCFPFFGVQSGVSGVGFNVAQALHTLGNPVTLLSLRGDDLPGRLVEATLVARGLDPAYVLPAVRETAQSVILYDGQGRRQAHTDVKDLQERCYPPERFAAALAGADLAVLSTINFARPLLAQARAAGVPIACDVQAVGALDDAYNADWMRAATILFMSHERLPLPPALWARAVQACYDPAILVVGLAAEGALLAVRGADRLVHVPAVRTRPVVSTIGAGDALFAGFLHAYRAIGDPQRALEQAVCFASWKIGVPGAGAGFLTAEELAALYAQTRAGLTAPSPARPKFRPQTD